MALKVLIFDIGGTVFDWNTALLRTLDRLIAPQDLSEGQRIAFAKACRAGFLDASAAAYRHELPRQSANKMLAEVINGLMDGNRFIDPGITARRQLALSWRHMLAWPGAREVIAMLRDKYLVVPLTILSRSMAIGSSQMNGIIWDSILTCEFLGVYKPDPRCYQRAAKILDVTPR